MVGGVLALGCGVVGLWWCPACMLCLLAAAVVHGWVACVVGLAPALGVGCWMVSVFAARVVAVCRRCCGVLLCFALLRYVLRCVALVRAGSSVLRCSSVRLRQLCVPRRCAILCYSGVCCAALFRCAPLSALVCRLALYAALHQQGTAATATQATWAMATLFYGGQVPVTSEDLDAATHL